jgi:DNA-binding beta-propeller fold protein YncE
VRTYVAASYDNTVLEFDARNVTRGALRTIPVGNRPVGISIRPDGAVVYTAKCAGHSVTAIDVSQNPPAIYSLSLVNEKHTNPRPLGIALDATGTRAYVSLGGDNAYVIALDTSEKQPHLAADLSVPSSAMSLGDTKLGIATSPTSSLLYAIAPGKNQLSYYDMGSDSCSGTRLKHIPKLLSGWRVGRWHRESCARAGRRDAGRRPQQRSTFCL